jgi:hypothetical protein
MYSGVIWDVAYGEPKTQTLCEMDMDPAIYLTQVNDAKVENATLRWLRQQGEVAKFQFIWNVYRINPKAGLVLVKKGQLKPIFMEVFLEHRFVYGDVSSVKWWLEATIEGIGRKKVLDMVESHIKDAPLVVNKILNHLPHFCWKQPELLNKIEKIKNEFNVKYPNFTSARSTGIHPTSA